MIWMIYARTQSSNLPVDDCWKAATNLHLEPTMSRWENAPDLRTLIRLTRAMVDLWCKSYKIGRAHV